MAHVFKPGDRAVVVKAPRKPENLGAVVTVLSGLMPLCGRLWKPGDFGYQVDLPYEKPFTGIAVFPDQIEPYRDDGSEKGEWTEELRKLCRVKENA